MLVDVASRAPHARKHGPTFADTFVCPDGTTIVTVGDVIAGNDPGVVGDLLRAGGRALICSQDALTAALAAFDRIVQAHAREHRDDTLAATIAVLAIPVEHDRVAFVGAGQLHSAIVRGLDGERVHLHGHAAALGTGVLPPPPQEQASQEYRLHAGDLVIAATFPVQPAWAAGTQPAEAVLHHAGVDTGSVAVVRV